MFLFVLPCIFFFPYIGPSAIVSQGEKRSHLPGSSIFLTPPLLPPVDQQLGESLGSNLDAWKHWHFANWLLWLAQSFGQDLVVTISQYYTWNWNRAWGYACCSLEPYSNIQVDTATTITELYFVRFPPEAVLHPDLKGRQLQKKKKYDLGQQCKKRSLFWSTSCWGSYMVSSVHKKGSFLHVK